MIIILEPDTAKNILDPDIRNLVIQRSQEILAGEPYDYDQHGYTIVVEPEDSVADLEEETHCCILSNLFDDTRYSSNAGAKRPMSASPSATGAEMRAPLNPRPRSFRSTFAEPLWARLYKSA